MRLRDLLICSVSLLIAAGLLIGAGMQLDYISSQRKEMKLITNEPLENAPPSLAFATVAMGAFRGLVVDVLWIRADNLKEKGQFFDAKQLAEWITTLQPRFAAVWEFHAWNMAYNISVAIPASQPDQRWRWVRNGYELLRDKGIELNPNAIGLYRELGRIFQHKIGDVSDDAHKYYKLQLATEIGPLLGPADNAYFDALVEAPRQWRDILVDPNVSELVERLREADEVFKEADSQEFVSSYLSLRQESRRFDPNAAQVIDDYRQSEALDKFDVFAKAYQLRKRWKLDPYKMRELNRKYGPRDIVDPNASRQPLDWRHPDVHAIYWAVKGLEVAARDEGEEVSGDVVNTDRMVAHGLQNLFRGGKLIIYDVPVEMPSEDPSEPPQVRMQKQVFLRPDLRMFQSYNESALAIIEKYRESEREGREQSLENGHRNMLTNALLMFYQSGHKQGAQKILNMLREYYPRPEFNVPLVQYARKRMLEELDSVGLKDAREQVLALLRQAYYLFAIHDDDAAYGREEFARQIHEHYKASYLDTNRIDLPAFDLLRYFALMDFLNDSGYPVYLRQNLLARIRSERPDLYEKLEGQEQMLRKQAEEAEEAEQSTQP